MGIIKPYAGVMSFETVLSHMHAQMNRIIPRKIAIILTQELGKLSKKPAPQAPAEFEWSVIGFAVGIGVYFALPFEPPLWLVALLALGFGGMAWAARYRPGMIRPLVFLIFLICLGTGRSAWHTYETAAPKLPAYERAYWVTGWVASEEKSGNRTKWKIAVTSMEDLPETDTPHFIRTSAAGDGIAAGDFIKIRSVLSAPPGPAVPRGYDPARAAFFNKIGGYGYAISKAEKIGDLPLSFADKMRRKTVQTRFGLAARIMEKAPPNSAGLQAGLLTGIRTYIPKEQTEALRAAGLAHILAISGLHMGFVAGSVYFLASLGLAFITPLSRRMDVRKPAAIIGAVAASAYLILSGASVATQRAYIMALIVFLAVLLDRRAFSMRSIALAALITLMWHPEALLSAGFQMSFSAVAALVAVYRSWDARRDWQESGHGNRRGNGRLGFFYRNFTSLWITSLVAGLATSGFAILHFNRMATYGLLGNMLAMPVFTFWVMPAAIAVFPASIVGLEHVPLFVMGKGVDVILFVSNWTASLKGALAYFHAAPPGVIALYGLGFAALCLGPNKIRLAAVGVMCLCLGLWAAAPMPDMRVSADGVIAFWSQDKGAGVTDELVVERKRADRYGRDQFTRRAGIAAPQVRLIASDIADCDALACRTQIKGKTFSLTAYPSEILEECGAVDLVILTKRSAGPVARRRCKAQLIDGDRLRENGAFNIYVKKRKILLEPALTQARRARPWGQ